MRHCCCRRNLMKSVRLCLETSSSVTPLTIVIVHKCRRTRYAKLLNVRFCATRWTQSLLILTVCQCSVIQRSTDVISDMHCSVARQKNEPVGDHSKRLTAGEWMTPAVHHDGDVSASELDVHDAVDERVDAGPGPERQWRHHIHVAV